MMEIAAKQIPQRIVASHQCLGSFESACGSEFSRLGGTFLSRFKVILMISFEFDYSYKSLFFF